MKTYKAYGPRDETPALDGDEGFIGVNNRLDPAYLQRGMLSDGQNIRCRNGVAETRKGVTKPAWGNKVNPLVDQNIRPYAGPMYGYGAFQDPDGLEWQLVAAEGMIFRSRPNNAQLAFGLPTGVKILGPVTFVQGFNKVVCCRGRDLAPLVLRSVDNGFEDLLPLWAGGTASLVGSEYAYGPFLAVSGITRVGGTATVVTVNPHGYVSGADITVSGANQAEYNGRWNIVVLDDVTFTFQVNSGAVTPATGTIKCSNMGQYWRGLGTLITTTSLTRAATVATATKNGHGFVNGDSVTVSGATPAGFNGTYVISGVTANTFQYTMAADPGADASVQPSIRNNTRAVPGQSPDTNPEAWAHSFNVLPNINGGVYANNRLFAWTAWTPGTSGYSSTSVYTKVDYLIALDLLDEVHFSFANIFRINQGSEDEIVDGVKFGQQTLVVFKGHSWGVLSWTLGDLTDATLDMRSLTVGLAAPRAWVTNGKDLIFASPGLGIISIRQTEFNSLQWADVPLSAEVQPWVDRIAWQYGGKLRMGHWDNKLYAAVPLDDGVCPMGPNAVAGFQAHNVASNIVYFIPVTVGVTYRFRAGNATALSTATAYDAGTDAFSAAGVIWTDGQVFTATQETYNLTGNYPSDGSAGPPTSVLKALSRGVNNAILVYDFLNQRWTSLDSGEALCVREFASLIIGGQRRLLFLAEDGYVNLVEESDHGDEIGDELGLQGIGRQEMTSVWRTRGYLFGQAHWKTPLELQLALASWAPSFTVEMPFEGVNDSHVITPDGPIVKDRRKWYRPHDKLDYDPTNPNGDHGAPGRQDYSVPLAPAGVSLGTAGVAPNLMQECLESWDVSSRPGRSPTVRIVNTQGRLRLKSVMVESNDADLTKGVVG